MYAYKHTNALEMHDCSYMFKKKLAKYYTELLSFKYSVFKVVYAHFCIG